MNDLFVNVVLLLLPLLLLPRTTEEVPAGAVGTEPPGHCMHEEAPKLAEYAVAGHAKHDVEPGRLLKDPGWHCAQVDWPAKGANDPGAQSAQVELAFPFPAKLPAAQRTQPVLPPTYPPQSIGQLMLVSSGGTHTPSPQHPWKTP